MTKELTERIGRKVLRRWLMLGHLNDYPYDIAVGVGAGATGSWILENGRNRIHISAAFTDEVVRHGVNAEKAVEGLLVHELGHSVHTLPFELNKGRDRLREEKIPFPLFNIFEDLRMERRVEEQTGYRFQRRNLLKKELYGLGSPEPELLLNALKNARLPEDFEEAKTAFIEANRQMGDPVIENPEKAAERILGYYYPAIVAKQDPFDLFPLMREWIDEFHDGEYEDEEERLKQFLQALIEALRRLAGEMEAEGGEEGESGDGGESESDEGGTPGPLMLDPTLTEAFEAAVEQEKELESEGDDTDGEDATAVVVVTSEACQPQKPEERKMAIGIPEELKTDTRTVEEFTSREIWEDEPIGDYDRRRADRLGSKFRKILDAKSRYEASKRPAKRFHTRNLVLGRDRQYKRKETEVRRKRHIAMVVDCSGSMHLPMKEFHIMFAILNDLAKTGLVEGELILSSNIGCQTIELPMADRDITRIQGEYGGEGLDFTLEHTLPLLKRADHVFVATDGNIGDRAVDKKRLRSAGVEPVGMYVGEYDSYLEKWFDRIVVKRTMEELIDELVRKIKGGTI